MNVNKNKSTPPFTKGEWITIGNHISSENYAPEGKRVWQAESTPEWCGTQATGSGFRHRGVCSSHFRVATGGDVVTEILRLENIEREVRAQRRELLRVKEQWVRESERECRRARQA